MENAERGHHARTEVHANQQGRTGHFDAAGRWVHELRLNGDESGANSQPRIPPFPANKFLGLDRPMILRITVYRHD